MARVWLGQHCCKGCYLIPGLPLNKTCRMHSTASGQFVAIGGGVDIDIDIDAFPCCCHPIKPLPNNCASKRRPKRPKQHQGQASDVLTAPAWQNKLGARSSAGHLKGNKHEKGKKTNSCPNELDWFWQLWENFAGLSFSGFLMADPYYVSVSQG